MFFVPFGLLQDSVTAPKLIGFLSICGLLLIKNKNLYTLSRLNLKILFFGLPISLFISSFFDEYSFFNNFVGDQFRYNGILLYFGASCATLLISLNFSIRLNEIYLVFTNIYLIIIVVQLMQRIGLDPLGGKDLNYPSLLGNTNFSSAVVATLGLGLLNFREMFKNYKLIKFFVLFSTILFSLIFFGAYQGFFVLVVGLGTFGYFYFAKNYIPNLKISSILFGIFWLLGFVTLYSVIKVPLLTSILYRSGNYERRLEYWNYALEMFRNKPLFGVGINGFLDYAQNLKTLDVIRKDGALVWIDSAHSVPLHFLATGGIFVFLAYFSFVIVTSIVGIRIIHVDDGKEFVTNLVLTSMWFGFQAQSLVSINQVATIILNSILAGLIWNKFLRVKRIVNVNIKSSTGKFMILGEERKIHRNFVSALGFLLIGFAIYIFIMQFFLSQNVKNLNNAWLKTNYLVKLYPSDRAIEYVANSAISQGELTNAIYLLEEAIRINPKNVRPKYTLGVAHELLGDKLVAEKFIFEAFSMNPLNTYFLEQLIRIEVANGHLDLAIEHLEKMKELDPNYPKLSELLNLL